MTSPSDGSLYPFSVVADAVVASFDMRDIQGICPTGIFFARFIEIVSCEMCWNLTPIFLKYRYQHWWWLPPKKTQKKCIENDCLFLSRIFFSFFLMHGIACQARCQCFLAAFGGQIVVQEDFGIECVLRVLLLHLFLTPRPYIFKKILSLFSLSYSHDDFNLVRVIELGLRPPSKPCN